MRRTIVSLFFTVLFALVIYAEGTLYDGYQLLQQARKGDESAVDKGIAFFESYSQSHADDVFALALLGCSYGTKAAVSSAPWNKIKWGNKGFKLLDEAYGKDPENLWIRFERALAFLRAPSVAKKSDMAYTEFAALVRLIDSKTDEYFFSVHGIDAYYNGTQPKAECAQYIRQRILFLAGNACLNVDKKDEARALWERVLQMNAVSEYGVKAADQLKKNPKE